MITLVFWMLFADAGQPVHRDFPHVRLLDACQFRIDASAAHANWLDSVRHKNLLHDRLWGWKDRLSWSADAEWCSHCWSVFEDVLGGSWTKHSLEWRLYRLNELRELLGDEAYQMRCMPPATPGWHFGGLMPDGLTPPSRR